MKCSLAEIRKSLLNQHFPTKREIEDIYLDTKMRPLDEGLRALKIGLENSTKESHPLFKRFYKLAQELYEDIRKDHRVHILKDLSLNQINSTIEVVQNIETFLNWTTESKGNDLQEKKELQEKIAFSTDLFASKELVDLIDSTLGISTETLRLENEKLENEREKTSNKKEQSSSNPYRNESQTDANLGKNIHSDDFKNKKRKENCETPFHIPFNALNIDSFFP